MSRINVQVLLATLGLKLPVIISERSVPSHLSLGKIWNFLRAWSYARSSCLVLQSQGVLTYFSKIPKLQTRVIPNPVIGLNACESDLKPKGLNRKEKILLSMGRLHEVKGYDLLLKAFAKVAQKHGDWTLVVWGEGPQRAYLEKLRDDLKIRDRVRFPGLTKKTGEEMRRADLFVLSSRCEGFPNVICEAFICGLPVISFDCPFGPREIIREGIDGLLVPPEDVEALAVNLDRLMTDEKQRNRLAERAPEVLERFSLEKIMGMWEEVLTSSLERERQN